MTVSQLISKLAPMPQDAEVLAVNYSEFRTVRDDDVSSSEDGTVVTDEGEEFENVVVIVTWA